MRRDWRTCDIDDLIQDVVESFSEGEMSEFQKLSHEWNVEVEAEAVKLIHQEGLAPWKAHMKAQDIVEERRQGAAELEAIKRCKTDGV